MDGNMIMMTVAAILILVSAVLYFITTFFGNAKKNSSSNKDNQNELVAELKKQNALIQSKMENLEREIRLLSGKQENQTKAVIKYNKENARQLAISERDTLMRVMQELKKAIENNAGSVVTKEASKTVPMMEEVAEVDLFAVSGLPADEEEPVPVEKENVAEESSLEAVVTEETPEIAEEPDLSALFAGMAEEDVSPVTAEPSLEDPFATEMPETPEVSEEPDLSALFAGMEQEPALVNEEISETLETPEFSDELDLSALFAEMGEDMPAAEEPVKQAASAADPLAGFGSDPNAMMTPEDIAKLLEAMGQ